MARRRARRADRLVRHGNPDPVKLSFTKMHGAGNDFVVLDGYSRALPPLTEAQVRALANRHFGIGAQILHDLGVRQIRLLTNNPRKVIGLDGYGLRIVERLPIQVSPGEHNAGYLKAKRDKLGHLLDDPAG